MSENITPGDLLRLAANESIVSAVLKWAAANGRRLTKADLERMGAGVDAMLTENERLTEERDGALARVKQLESEWSGWPALQREWFGGDYAAMQPWDAVRARIEDSEARVKRLKEAGDELVWGFCPASVSMMTERESDALNLWNAAKEARP